MCNAGMNGVKASKIRKSLEARERNRYFTDDALKIAPLPSSVTAYCPMSCAEPLEIGKNPSRQFGDKLHRGGKAEPGCVRDLVVRKLGPKD